ncbi:glycerophosphoryl diester phosphodiesterase membrane domain-containing protein [Erythrobacter tepidarius]|uniref:glycerophosphoryl diester phosphodiesterase membrane domain-containing protein n=1 Tax=Erythrobacter tepidarius TaxID=60454 RepID=UPI000A37FB80|nr:glycerophosphoryl diester phosphodiesterase membrane domain-containing protein [Erythrobacter tepidarius]
MANAKLDMGKAWTQATALIGANKDTISALAGLFFFLPSFAAGLMMPEVGATLPVSGPGQSGDPQAAMQQAMDQFAALYADSWPALVAISIAGFIGSMSLLALLTDRGHPTVGEALGKGVRSIPSYIAAQLLSALAAGVAIGVPLALLAALAPPVVVAIAGLALVVLVIYVAVKFSLIAPVIAIDEERNPVAAIARSWRLTKGNSLRIFAFFVLLFVVIVIIGALVQGILTLILSAAGGEVARIGIAAVNALVNAIITVIFLVVLAAVHRQLAGAAPERLAETFE